VNNLPESERRAPLADAPPFDPLSAPVFHEVGFFAEGFWRRSGTRVTDNPSGRFAARGRLALDLLADAPWHDYYGPGSPASSSVSTMSMASSIGMARTISPLSCGSIW
jgi:hypothetical protein